VQPLPQVDYRNEQRRHSRDRQDWLLANSGFDYLEGHHAAGFINWGTLLGLAITIGIGAGFWTGVGLLIARFWR
jgi:hypothetical protein